MVGNKPIFTVWTVDLKTIRTATVRPTRMKSFSLGRDSNLECLDKMSCKLTD